MPLLSDRDSFDRLVCQRIYFADAVKVYAATVPSEGEARAIDRYAHWRAHDDGEGTSLDQCFEGIDTDRRQVIIDTVNELWHRSRP